MFWIKIKANIHGIPQYIKVRFKGLHSLRTLSWYSYLSFLSHLVHGLGFVSIVAIPDHSNLSLSHSNIWIKDPR